MDLHGTADQPTPEQAFLRFREHGDVEALAEVFDQTAPRLLLVAAHVTPDPAAAEDLVQDTFLKAMERAAQWNATLPLLPWLCTILRNRAIDLSRRLRVRRPVGDAEEIVERAAAQGIGPAETVARDELLGRVEAALAELESPFREALVLRLVHGLEPTEIAHALGRNPNTVRVQLKRGLDRLRGQLPVGVGAALAALLLPGAGMAAVRTAVIARAAAPAAAGAVVVGATSGRAGLWLAALAVLALGVGLWVAFEGSAGSPARTEVADSSGGDDKVASQAGAVGSADRTQDPAAFRAPATMPAADGMATLRGRVVSASDGRPLLGGKITASYARGRWVTNDPTFRTYPEPVVAEAAMDGTFVLTFATEPKVSVSVSFTAPGHAETETWWPSVRPGLDHDLGDVALLRGRELRVRVVDANGAPVEGVELSVERHYGEAGEQQATFGAWSSFDAVSDANGEVEARIVPAPFDYTVKTAYDEHDWRAAPVKLRIEPDLSPIDAVLVVARADNDSCLAGRVVDENGRPLAGVTLCVDGQMADMGEATSAADGTFRLAHGLPPRPLPLELKATDLRHRLLEPDREYSSNANDALVRVAVLPGHDVTVEVVDARDGTPVESFGLRHELDYWREDFALSIPPDRFYWPIAAEHHDGGRAVLPGLCPGHYRVNVHSGDPALATAYMVPLEVGAEGVPGGVLRVELQPLAPLRVRVVDDRGTPKRGVLVRLVHRMASEGRYSSLFSVEELARGVGGGREMAVALQTAYTDADGAVLLRAPSNEPRVELKVGGGGVWGKSSELSPVPREGADVTVTVPATATLRGRVTPPEFARDCGPDAELQLQDRIVRAEDSELLWFSPRMQLVAADGRRQGEGALLPDGTFEIVDALPGDWQLQIRAEWRADGDYQLAGEQLVEVKGLVADEVRELELDLAHLMPVRLTGAVRVDGAPFSAGSFGVVRVRGDKAERHFLKVSSAARFTAALAPGAWLPFVAMGDDDDERFLFLDRRVQLSRGADVDQLLAFEPHVLRLELLTADGRRAVDTALEVRAVDFPEVHGLVDRARRTDADGMLLLDPAPPGRLHVVRAADGVLLGEVAGGPAGTAATLRLPE
ncbi:MAG: sigma-70 family RNA polymerase sigma factor [Planctomycetota bacterium]